MRFFSGSYLEVFRRRTLMTGALFAWSCAFMISAMIFHSYIDRVQLWGTIGIHALVFFNCIRHNRKERKELEAYEDNQKMMSDMSKDIISHLKGEK